eukprot:4453762-Pleurochrysis_carterae.AAC.1
MLNPTVASGGVYWYLQCTPPPGARWVSPSARVTGCTLSRYSLLRLAGTIHPRAAVCLAAVLSSVCPFVRPSAPSVS